MWVEGGVGAYLYLKFKLRAAQLCFGASLEYDSTRVTMSLE